MPSSKPKRLKTISDLHRFNEILAPEHPLISLIDYSRISPKPENNELKWVQQFYTISIKRNVAGKYRYGQQSYDFDEGLMTFFSPEQVISVQMKEEDLHSKPTGWILAVHPDYLSSMLKSLTGQTTRQRIHHKLIEKAKIELSTTDLSISEIAYGLGFEHSQSFSKLFKSKTKQTPLEFRTSFN